MTVELSLKEIQKEWHGSLKSYVVGFLASLLLTGISFYIVFANLFSGHTLFYAVIGLAVAQAIIQLIFFLHVGQEAKPRWETISLCFTIMVLLIVVIGSLWIMFDLENRVMPDMAKEMSSHD